MQSPILIAMQTSFKVYSHKQGLAENFIFKTEDDRFIYMYTGARTFSIDGVEKSTIRMFKDELKEILPGSTTYTEAIEMYKRNMQALKLDIVSISWLSEK